MLSAHQRLVGRAGGPDEREGGMSDKKSCLTCRFGKPEKQPEGYYCNNPKMILNKTGPHGESCWYKYQSPCGENGWGYELRPNQCETDGCKWMVEGKCRSMGVHNVSYTGQPCFGFEKEESMGIKFEHNGVWYERTDKVLSIESLIENAMNNSCLERNVTRFICTFGLEQKAIFCDDEDEITLTPQMITWLCEDSPAHIPWLVDKGYLREAVEETYQSEQWFKYRTEPYPYQIVRVSTTKIIFYCPGNGLRCGDPVTVENTKKITREELAQLISVDDIISIPDPIIKEQE